MKSQQENFFFPPNKFCLGKIRMEEIYSGGDNISF